MTKRYEPEQLKRVAESMDSSRPVEIEDDEVWYMHYPPTTGEGTGVKILATQFNPLEDNNQCLELMEKLNISVKIYEETNNHPEFLRIFASTRANGEGGKTINEAVTLAAIASIDQRIKES